MCWRNTSNSAKAAKMLRRIWRYLLQNRDLNVWGDLPCWNPATYENCQILILHLQQVVVARSQVSTVMQGHTYFSLPNSIWKGLKVDMIKSAAFSGLGDFCPFDDAVLATASSARGRFGDRQFGDGTFRRSVF